jgi:hypothetical protein
MKQEVIKSLQSELVWVYARTGAFQRASIYNRKATEKEKSKFRAATKKFLFKVVFLKYYNGSISERQLKSLIAKFIKGNKDNRVLAGKQLQYGNAQKFINLYLKGMWVLGYLKTPPHFPVDRIILNELGIKANWTSMGEEKYDEVMAKAKKKISESKKYKTIAEWEAEAYQKIHLAS